jgi:hypothetical protein
VFPSLAHGFPDAPWEASVRQLGEQLHDLARCANMLVADNPGWIAPSQVAVARRLAEAAAVLQSHAEQVVPRA